MPRTPAWKTPAESGPPDEFWMTEAGRLEPRTCRVGVVVEFAAEKARTSRLLVGVQGSSGIVMASPVPDATALATQF